MLSYTLVLLRGGSQYFLFLEFLRKDVNKTFCLFYFLGVINDGRCTKYVSACISYGLFQYVDILTYFTLVFRLLKLKEMFNSKFGSVPKFYVRAPGRVNIIGISKLPSLSFSCFGKIQIFLDTLFS